jgi:hypothetical protein
MTAAALIIALSVSLYTLFLLSCSFTPVQTHHVIFEEIGEMAGALSYIQVIIPINISRLLHAIDDFRGKVVAFKTKYTDKAKYANRLDKYGGANPNDPAKHVLFHFRRQLSGLMDLMIIDADNLQSSITSLRTSLPRVEEPPSWPTQVHDLREKRSAGLIIRSTFLSGVFGTLMGWFTHRCLNNLRDQIGEVRNQQHQLLQIQQVTLAQLDDL